MASVQERLKLKRAPTDVWSIREQLCLASSVLKSGDQNWMIVSRCLKPTADKYSKRPADWFSPKCCAQQYAHLLENVDIPKRKKKESTETSSEFIVRRLTQERISELTKILALQKEEYQLLKNELRLLKNGTISNEKLQKFWFAIEEEKNKANATSVNRHQSQHFLSSISNFQNIDKITTQEFTTECQEINDSNRQREEDNTNGKSSLLTSLLESRSPTNQVKSTQVIDAPTIATFFCSSSKVPEPVNIENVSLQLHHLVSNTNIDTIQDRPSSSAPTLSMLLEQPSSGAQRISNQESQSHNELIPSNSQIRETHNVVQTRLGRLSQHMPAEHVPAGQIHQVISNLDATNAEIPHIISNSISQAIPQVIEMNKDEINEMIGDIEELIKEEITSSPQKLTSASRPADIIGPTQPVPERSEPRNVDDPVSLSNSPISDISIEEIDSSSSNIAEIIGTAIGTIDSKGSESVSIKNLETVQNSITTEKTGSLTESAIVQQLKTKLFVAQESTLELKNSNDVHDETFSEIQICCQSSETQENYPINFVNSCQINDLEARQVGIVKIDHQDSLTLKTVNISLAEKKDDLLEEEKNERVEPGNNIVEHDVMNISLHIKDQVISSKLSKKSDNLRTSSGVQEKYSQDKFAIIDESIGAVDIRKEMKSEVSSIESKKNNQVTRIITEDFQSEIKTEVIEAASDESVTPPDIDSNEIKPQGDTNFMKLYNQFSAKREKLDDILEKEETIPNQSLEDNILVSQIKIESRNEDDKDEHTEERGENMKKIQILAIKEENSEPVVSTEELDEEESSLSQLNGSKVMKTYSKKQNSSVDSEPENETCGETADYRAWKKSIMLVYNRLATHKYASIFLRPITEDQAPGYHSIIFRPMDLLTIKKNIDNGTIRSTTHFQRDVMLMFQNAIMYNKFDALIHKMTLEMQEECLQHMQVLVRATGEASFRRETRTAASISSDTSDNNLKRKWSHITSNSHEMENPRLKKRRKSENE